MRVLGYCFAVSASVILIEDASAAPVDSSCRFMEVVGSNDALAVSAMMTEIASTWPEANRIGAIDTLTGVLKELTFAGGSVWRVGKLGDDIEEHLVLLRLASGEVSGVRLLYQWSPDGLELTTMDFNRRFNEIVATQFLQTPQELECDGND